MFINSEYKKQVILNMEDIIKDDDYEINDIDILFDILDNIKNCWRVETNEPQNYYYTIDCINEKEALQIDEYIYDCIY